MLTGSAVLRLTHIVKSSMPTDIALIGLMEAVDEVRLSTWLDCTEASSLKSAMSTQECELVSSSLDLLPQFGGIRMQSLIKAASEELLGSWASVAAILISFLQSKGLDMNAKLADIMVAMADDDTDPLRPVIPTVSSLLVVSSKAQCFLSDITQT